MMTPHDLFLKWLELVDYCENAENFDMKEFEKRIKYINGWYKKYSDQEQSDYHYFQYDEWIYNG